MKYLLPLMILHTCQLIQGILEWIVVEKITDYGQNVTLFCNVSNCCPKNAGWDKYIPTQETLFIDLKKGRLDKKYDGKVLKDGYTLIIQNLTKEDLNVSYACVYGSTIGNKQFLLEENVFNSIEDMSSTQQNGPMDEKTFSAGDISTTQQNGAMDTNTISAGDISTKQQNSQTVHKSLTAEKISGIILGVSVAVLAVFFMTWFLNLRKERQKNTRISIEGSIEEIPLINYFLEEPNDINCIEGDDAILTCKLRPDVPPLKWLKNGKEIIHNEKYIMSMEDAQHTLTLKTTTESDSGDYYVNVGEFSKKIQLSIIHVTELPIEISRDERNTYMDAIKSGIETRQYVRIQVIGKDRVGKTSLVRRLLFLEDGKYNGISTDGIEIIRKCQIRKNDGKWFVGEVDTTKSEIIRRTAGALEHSETVSNQTCQRVSKDYVLETETKQNEQILASSKEYLLEIEKKQRDKEPLVSYEKVIGTDKLDVVTKINQAATTFNADDNELCKADTTEKQTHDDFTNTEVIYTRVMSADQITETTNHKLDEIILRAKTVKEKNESDGLLVECGIWDFAGQKDYYATHQTFFTPHAIYLIVADIEDNIKPITHNEDDYYCIEDYIDFWFESIHCFCDDHSTNKNKLCPPVIMVYTGTDKFEKAENKEIYAVKLLDNFGKDKKFNHNRGIYFISNTQFKEEDSNEIKNLRQHISEIAFEMGYFAETLPTKWIQLETELEVLQESHIYVYSWNNMEKLAQKYSLEEKELFVFLNYQHKIGNVIFFKEISEYIILQPNWLVKCFRCLVCDCHKGKRNYNLISPTAWNELKSSGELSDVLINQLFKKEPELKFGDHKAYLLNIMEKFDIVIKPQFRDTRIDKCQKSESYYLPCMIEKSSTYNSIFDEFIPKSSDVSITPWLVFEFEFLPLAYFNHILFYYIRKYEVCKVKALYRGKAVFYLDELSKFIICFSHNAVSVQIWRWDVLEDNVYPTVLNELCDTIETIQEKLRHTISYSIKAKCSSGDYSKSEDRITLKDVSDKEVYFCDEHCIRHSMDDIRNSWFKHLLFKEKINFTKMGMIVLNILVDVLYDLLKPDKPNLRPRSDVDVPYLYSEHRKLNKHIPSNLWGRTWQTIQNTDIAIGDDIERIRLTRNELQHSHIFKLEDKRFLELCYIISDLLKRFDRHNKPTMLYADRLNDILAKTISQEEVKSIENEMDMTFEVDIEH